MKVVQVIPNLKMGGAETMCENMSYALKNKGIDVTVVSLYNCITPISKRLENAGIDVVFLNKKGGFDISIYHDLKMLFKRLKPDAVHTHLYAQKYAMPVVAKSVTKVHTIHNIAEKELGKCDKKIAAYLYKYCGVIPVALSELIQETIINYYHCAKDSVPVIYNGIDLSKCIPKDNYKIGESVKIINVASFGTAKNHLGLISAFKIFNDTYKNSKLILVGDGDKRAEIEAFIKENGLENNVDLMGIQSNVFGFLNEADIFTLPSIYEGLPMSIIEAMGTGLPIVATAVGGIPNMLTNGENALLTEIDSNAVAEAFLQLVQSEELREKLGKNAIERSLTFSADEMADKYIRLYTKEKAL